MENIWEISVDSNITTYPIDNTYYPYKDINTPSPYNYFTYTSPTTIYKYQIQCPSCEKFNWLELDKISVCTTKKCEAKLKAVSQKVDHEIEVS